MTIEIDEAKRAATLEARGLDQARAGDVFAGAPRTVKDDRQDSGEERFLTLGVLDAVMVVLIWTPRDRPARGREGGWLAGGGAGEQAPTSPDRSLSDGAARPAAGY